MKTLIIVLIIVSFVQSTIFPLDLVLIILICRSYLNPDKNNLYLAFAFGLLLSHLDLRPLGLQSLIYLILVQITQKLTRSRLAGHWLMIAPITFILLASSQLVNALFASQTVQTSPGVLIGSILSWPIFYLVKLWEERYTPQKEIKLKL